MQSHERVKILQDLQSRDEEVRWLAVEHLSQLQPAEAIPVLVERLGDSSWRVRKAAIERLAETPDLSRSVEALVVALADGENPGRRNAALEALTRCGRAAVPALIEASRSSDADVRKQVVDALAGIGHAEAAQRLIEVLRDEDPNVRGAAADALGSTGGDAAVAALLRALQEDAEPLVRLSALLALGRLEAVVPVLALEGVLADALLRPAAYALLAESDDPRVTETLLKALDDTARSAREAAMQALVRLAARSAPDEAAALAERLRARAADLAALVRDGVERLREADLPRRMTLVQFFGLLRSPETVLPMLEAGRDEALTEIVLSALASFGEVSDPQVASQWRHIPPEIRPLACVLLGRTRGQAGEALLRKILRDADPELRAAAARALGTRCCTTTLPELVAGLLRASEEGEEALEEQEAFYQAIVAVAYDADSTASGVARQAISLLEQSLGAAGESFRLAAARILGRVGSQDDLARLQLLLSDPSPQVRRAAVEALARVAPDACEPLRLGLADEAASVRIGAIAALAASGDPSVIGDLCRILSDPQERVRAAVVRALGVWLKQEGALHPELRDVAMEALCSVLPEGGSAAMAAVEALRELGGSEAVARVRGLLAARDPELVEHAVVCIGQHADAEALQDILPLISHDSWVVRAQTIQVMAMRNVAQAVPALLRRLEVEQDAFVRDALMSALARLEQ